MYIHEYIAVEKMGDSFLFLVFWKTKKKSGSDDKYVVIAKV